jgi:hypothetical protein
MRADQLAEKGALGSVNRPSHAFDPGATPFGLQASHLRFTGGPRLAAGFGLFCGLSDQSDQPIHGILTIPFLRAESPCLYDQHPVFRDPLSSQTNQALPNVSRKTMGLPDVEAELDGRGNLVYVLPSRAAGTDEILPDFLLVNGDGWGDLNHPLCFQAEYRPPQGPAQNRCYSGRLSGNHSPLHLRTSCPPDRRGRGLADPTFVQYPFPSSAREG